MPGPPPGQPIPSNMRFMYLPRIRCYDCPGKVYTPGPDMTVTNFEVHLRNRVHREKVDQRLTRLARAASQGSTGGAAASAGTSSAS